MTDFNSTQPSFSAGIISTELFSRIDYSKLASGLKQCENWEIRPAGGAAYRAGTKFIASTKNNSEVSLIPFTESRDSGYCCEFGARYIRFYKDGKQILNGGVPVEVATTYTESELKELKYAQHKNEMYIVHKNHCPAILRRVSDTVWTLTDMVFNPSVAQVASVTISKGTAKTPSTVVDYDKWQYAVSVVDPSGNEGMATKSNVITSDIDLTNQHITVSFNSPDGLTDGYCFNVYRIFRGEFYFVYKLEFVSGTTSYSLEDLSFQADTTKSIKKRFEAFDGGNYPSSVGFWNQRLLFANTEKAPNTIYGSCVGVYDDFTTTVINNDDESFELELNSGTTDFITDVIPLDDMIVMTQSKIWRVVGTSAKNMSAYIESYSGSSGLRPYTYKKSILYVDSSRNTISNFIYSYELNGYVGQNLDILCRDLFDGHEITDITFRDTPFGVLYVVRNDGVLLGLTYLKEENIYAWHKHTTDGKFKAICNVDKSLDDDVYVVVERDGVKYIELFQQQIDIEETVNDSWHLDCAEKYESNVSTWINESSTGSATNFYGYKTSPKTINENLYCWKVVYVTYRTILLGIHTGFGVGGGIAREPVYTTQYYYNYSSQSYDFKNMYATSGKTTTADFSKLSKVSVPTANLYSVSRHASGDFVHTYTERPTNPIVYIKNLLVGEEVFLKTTDAHGGAGVSQIGTIDSVSGTDFNFDGFTYEKNESEDFILGVLTKTTTYAYTDGKPVSGQDAYKNLGLSVVLGTITSVGDNVITVGGLDYSLSSESTENKNVITGLSRFAGKAVTVVADGNVLRDLDVINDEVKLDHYYSNILVGLPYEGILEPIPVDVKYQSGNTSVGLNRRINKATIRYYRTRGLWYGTSINNLFEIKPYTNETFGENIPLESNVLNAEVMDTYKTESSFLVIQKSPLPALIQSITLGLSYGEKN